MNQTVGAKDIVTTLPTQARMVSKSNKFAKVNLADASNIVAFYDGPIATENLVLWNTGFGSLACNSLQAGTYARIKMQFR
jgi:hypothetical protein